MDIIYPWLDPVEVRRLAERLMTPSRDLPLHSSKDAGFPDGFEGFGVENPAPVTPPQPPPLALEPEPEPIPAAPPAVELPTPAAHTETALPATQLERLHRFRDWMRDQFAASGMFILDREGTVIFDESDHGHLHFMARSLALKSQRPGSPASNIRLKVTAEDTLELIPIQTPQGFFVLGVIVPETLTPQAIQAVMDALGLVASQP